MTMTHAERLAKYRATTAKQIHTKHGPPAAEVYRWFNAELTEIGVGPILRKRIVAAYKESHGHIRATTLWALLAKEDWAAYQTLPACFQPVDVVAGKKV